MPSSAVSFKVGPEFATVREMRGMTQRDLGIKTGMGAPGVSRFEGGHKTVRGKIAHRIAKVLQLSFQECLDREVFVIVRGEDQGATRGAKASAS